MLGGRARRQQSTTGTLGGNATCPSGSTKPGAACAAVVAGAGGPPCAGANERNPRRRMRNRKTRTWQTIYAPDCRLAEQPRRQAVRIRSRTSGRASNPAALYVATPPTLELGVQTRALDEPISRSAAAPATVIARP